MAVAQHKSKLTVTVDHEKSVLGVYQELTYNNQTNDTIKTIVLNDWNNAYADKNSPLGERFSDEFVRMFHLATDKERGNTNTITIIDSNKSLLNWNRPENGHDLIEFELKNPILSKQTATFTLSYFLKIPSNKFTKYGYNNEQELVLHNWFLTPSRYENKTFIKYNNLNLDDAPNALSDIDLQITCSENYKAISDLTLVNLNNGTYTFTGKNRLSTSLFIEKNISFQNFKNEFIEITCNLEDKKVTDINKAILIDKVVNFVKDNLGDYPNEKIIVSQIDYEINPFYGLNQLPSFISPFPDEFIFELKFLKTYLNNYLKTSLQLDSRKDNWIFDAIQIYYMMNYIDEFYPNMKMMGSIAKLKLLKGYNLVSLDFNEQYSYFYMLMARKNLDQPLGDPKNTLIKFNEKIASKYRAGLSFRYLSDYIGATNLKSIISSFVEYAKKNQTGISAFEAVLRKDSPKKIDWFLSKIINSRAIIDYKFDNVTKSADSISFQLINKTKVNVPIPIYGIKNKNIVFKQWIDDVKKDSVYKMKRFDADKIVVNYENEVPEFNQRNNWKSLKSFGIGNKPVRFNFMKDLENPFYNQILYVPTIQYNFYDGFIPGIRFHNKTILDRPFNFDITPSYSTKSESLSGSFSFVVNHYNRESDLFNIRYGFSGDYFRYAPDATYQKVNPFVSFRFREKNYRDNHRKSLLLRLVYVNREKSEIVTNTFEGNYGIFNARYVDSKTEITKHLAFSTDLQISSKFGKTSGEISYRRLFDDNRQINIRLYGGIFLYNATNSNFFDFALDRPSDYLFDFNYLGRSENTGLLSQQYIQAEGGLKAKLNNPFANQWMTTINSSFNIWNWIEVYSDFGLMKSKFDNDRFVFDSGIRLNLVTDYFELYFPVYTTNGWEIAKPNYNERVRFIVAFSPKSLIGLFTRKWF
jgi:hypothetical protein